MRKVFSSQRLENVEAVAELLRAEGIEVKITHGRSYRGHRRGSFSYDSRRMPEDVPSVWILRSEDQPRGRQLLRELGLLESTREPGASYLSTGRHGGTGAATDRGLFGGKRLKLGLLLLIAAGVGLITYVSRKPPAVEATAATSTPAVSDAPAMPVPEAITDLQEYRADVPTALARLLVADTLAKRKPAHACVAVDGADPSPALLAVLPAGPARLSPASTCSGKGALAIHIHDYTTDGSGRGQVRLDVGTSPTRTLDVEREGTVWRVLASH